MLWQLQQCRVADEVQAQRLAADGIVRTASDLDQATTTVLEAIPIYRIDRALRTQLAAVWGPTALGASETDVIHARLGR